MATVQNCVVCGAGSHREDWVKKFKTAKSNYVACDNHKDEEIKTAITKAEAPPADAKAATEKKPN